ncbi:MAG: hypothetical protein ACE5J9_04885 [Methanosarcinales archaeon]
MNLNKISEKKRDMIFYTGLLGAVVGGLIGGLIGMILGGIIGGIIGAGAHKQSLQRV